MKEKRAAMYVRVSTAEQDTDMQETDLRQYVESRGWEYVVYRDKAQSGAENDRPALNAMLNDMRRRKFDVIVIWKLDRLARSLKQLLTIGEECRSLSVDLVSLSRTSTPHCQQEDLPFKSWGRSRNLNESCCGNA
jgi:site-specific DNA recombinase